MKTIIERSNRHAHLTKETYELLFGDMPINPIRELNVLGEFAGDKFLNKNVDGKQWDFRIMLPFRPYDQIEVSQSEHYKLFGEYATRMDSGMAPSDHPFSLLFHSVIDATIVSIPVIVPRPHAHSPDKYLRRDHIQSDFVTIAYEQKYGKTRDGNTYIHLDADLYAALGGN